MYPSTPLSVASTLRLVETRRERELLSFSCVLWISIFVYCQYVFVEDS
ncbi:hypothetical protein BVRB_2g035070 [Beta vulgaris subsp. vulgaris]|nr:hypothetical protein BVRB_2g035070 [Beta vulgaris subsp. vulgaris]